MKDIVSANNEAIGSKIYGIGQNWIKFIMTPRCKNLEALYTILDDKPWYF